MWSSLKIRTELYEQIAAIAKDEQRSVANMTEVILREALSGRGPSPSSSPSGGGSRPQASTPDSARKTTRAPSGEGKSGVEVHPDPKK